MYDDCGDSILFGKQAKTLKRLWSEKEGEGEM